MPTYNPDICHGWSAVCCAACGVVAPCARPDCPSCYDVLDEAIPRRERKEQWVKDGTLDKCAFATLPAKDGWSNYAGMSLQQG